MDRVGVSHEMRVDYTHNCPSNSCVCICITTGRYSIGTELCCLYAPLDPHGTAKINKPIYQKTKNQDL